MRTLFCSWVVEWMWPLYLKTNANLQSGEAGFKLTKGLKKSDKCRHKEDISN